MSSATWTADALSSEARPASGTAWRLVEAQHQVATLKLTDDLAEQAVLENLIETTKEPIPAECRGLDYLLFTPFRYAPYPHGSRYRRAGLTPGVFYAAEAVATAVAETAFYRLLFFAESPATPWPANPLEMTAFAVPYAHPRALDLLAPAFDPVRPALTRLHDYDAPQRFAEDARDVGVGVIRYPSARDPGDGVNLALLTCAAFTAKAPTERQTWRVLLNAHGAHCRSEVTRAGIRFGRDAFAADSRLDAMRWDR